MKASFSAQASLLGADKANLHDKQSFLPTIDHHFNLDNKVLKYTESDTKKTIGIKHEVLLCEGRSRVLQQLTSPDSKGLALAAGEFEH